MLLANVFWPLVQRGVKESDRREIWRGTGRTLELDVDTVYSMSLSFIFVIESGTYDFDVTRQHSDDAFIVHGKIDRTAAGSF